MPTGSPIQCGHCGSELAPGAWSLAPGNACPACAQPVQVWLFPALQHDFTGHRPEALLGNDDAACYFHADHRATTACDHCGRFLCALCDLPVDSRHLCSPCLAAGAQDKLVTHRVRYDSLALALSTLSFFTTYIAIFPCFAALWFVFRHWSDAPGPFPRGRWRFVAATICAVAQILFWGGIIGFAIYSIQQGRA